MEITYAIEVKYPSDRKYYGRAAHDNVESCLAEGRFYENAGASVLYSVGDSNVHVSTLEKLARHDAFIFRAYEHR